MNGSISERPFGIFENKPVTEYTLTNANGMQVSVINYGATITRIDVPGKEGRRENVVLGFESLEGYFNTKDQYIGSIVGRYCNRIAGAAFFLDGKKYQLAANNLSNSLHGGIRGFDKMWWAITKDETTCSIISTYRSKDGEEGFPGNLDITVTYTLGEGNDLSIDYLATTDKPTPVNLTSHCYFNLSAGKSETILDHELTLFSETYTAIDEEAIPTGILENVKNTPFDFRSPKKIGLEIDKLNNGYDINYVLNDASGKAAILYDPLSGRCMEVFTTEPGLQFYSGNFLPTAITNPATGKSYLKHAAICLEAQHFPNSPNVPAFPNCILRPGETYRQKTVYKFSVK